MSLLRPLNETRTSEVLPSKHMDEIDHQYTTEIVCPKCGYKLRDSWEFDDSGTHKCGECEASFSYDRIVSCTYVTKLIP